MGESPLFTLKRHIDTKGLHVQQGFLLVIAVLMLGCGLKAAQIYGWASLYAVAALGAGAAFAVFSLAYGMIVRGHMKDTCYQLFENRIEYHRGKQVLHIIPLSEIGDISEERTQWQKKAGLTTVVLDIRPDSHLRNEAEVAYFVLADVPAADEPSELIYELLHHHRDQQHPTRG